MHRNITNVIRAVMDDWIPPKIRDSRWFMYPFFWYWYNGDKEAISAYMDFKSRVWSMSKEEYERFYTVLRQKSRAAARPTDLNDACVEYMLRNIDPDTRSVLDVGCGNGFFLRQLQTLGKYELHACDVLPGIDLGSDITYHQGNIENLPFADASFDVVTCHHTIEHIPDLPKAVAELKRVCRKQIMVVTPRQRYYYYTLDEHINFFPTPESVERLFQLPRQRCLNLGGDWMYVGYPETPPDAKTTTDKSQ
jgi:SAM-dependent methyltransferase